MQKKGQIVEILRQSPVFTEDNSDMEDKRDQLGLDSNLRTYSLFDGIIVGEHDGVEAYKIGQRKKLTGGGHQQALYVISIDSTDNRLFVGAGDDHPGLFTKVWHWYADEVVGHTAGQKYLEQEELELSVMVKLPYVEELQKAVLYKFENDLYLEFVEKQKKQSLMQHLDIYHEGILILTTKID